MRNPRGVRLLWDVCRIPDFRGISHAEHANLLARIFGFLQDDVGRVPDDWMARQVKRIDRSDGDIDTLSKDWHISAHGPMSRNVRAGWMMKAIGVAKHAR